MTTIADQPPPVANSHPAIADLVIADMRQRKILGLERYGTPLQPHNGRDALVDAYQEALDLTMYLRQAIEERRMVRSREERVAAVAATLRAHVGEACCNPRSLAELLVDAATGEAATTGATP
jgi:hypothetical protein